MKKNILRSVLAAGVAAAMLAGCGSAGEAPAEAPATEETAPAEAPATEETAPAETAGEPTTSDAAYGTDFDPTDVVVSSDDHQMETYIEGCDTFTQIIDKEENKGRGYTNVHIGDDDVLLVASGTYAYEEDKYAAIDAEIFHYADEGPAYMGYVTAGGTAYPLTVKDDYLYVGGNHFMMKYTIREGALIPVEEAYVTYDTDGNATYYYKTETTDFTDSDSAAAEQKLNALYDESFAGEVIWFDTIGGVVDESTGELPRYTYPDDDPYCNAITDYFIDEIAPQYMEAQLSVPQIAEIAVDDSDPEDVKVWGDFFVYNYDLDGTVLMFVSGGNHCGLIHLKKNDDGTATVTSFDQVEDGSNFDPSAKKIFGEYYDKFMEVNSDNESREEFRKNILINYVEDNGLNITAYQDYGWDPVELK